jgi:hypothetical protein
MTNRRSPAQWEHAELERSRARGVWDTWAVQDAELRGDWLWVAFDNRRIYAPLEHKELPHQFARIATEADALMPFVQQYGRLGWGELRQDEEGLSRLRGDAWLQAANDEHERLCREHAHLAWFAEPLDWIRAHAQTVHWCLAAAHALQGLTARARTRRCSELTGQLPRPMGRRGTISHRLFREKLLGKVSAEKFVGGMLEDYLWINLRGVRRRVQYVGGGSFRAFWGGESLIESIYTLIADAVTGGRLAQCQAPDCGAVFLQTDERQRFCPPREGQEKSACMNRLRVRRYRQQQRQEGRHGKASRPR